jgi:chromosome segregation ATPase
VDGTEKDTEASQIVSDQAREFLSKRTKEVSEMQAAASSLNVEVGNAKSALEERERAIHSLSAKFDELKEQYLLEQRDNQMLKEELRLLQHDTQVSSLATQKEKDSLMLAVAKLSTSTTTLEMQLKDARAEKAELDSRNAGLRQMNEEMMSMLEKAHGV